MTDRKRTEFDWQDMRIFLALGRYGSLSATARALRVNHATVARRVQSLEESVGRKLVERRPEGYVLTPAGKDALQVAAEMESAAQTMRHSGAGEDDGSLRGLVRINAPPALSQGFLLARLTQLTESHPGIDIDLATNLRSVSLDRHKADIAVRVGSLVDADLIAKPLGSMAFGFYGATSQCERIERGEPPVFVSFNEESADMPGTSWLRQQFPHARVSLRAENHILQAIAARDGAGVALLPHYLGRCLPGLSPCALGPTPPSRDMWLLIRRQDRNVPTLRVVMQHLIDAFKESEALFDA
ncbi:MULTISPECIES: LysR family transcriptional regulator [Burkholderia]|uniref:LysR family transcriptional regulator n=2 Tax=Burkholderiaceae TaxID=119060 RepID=A0A2A7SC90_BURGA|nr:MULTISPECIES: LysR family transcriptional regulator [Burkholderia]MBU9214880.1 LysR family transcriptional regulator [Burkholderia gladioli]MBU9425085.1 LysR family transcriptional regulator [Burkholderia gladioli]MDN7723278.1 LysR family transcriptional regulator [Burkholderia gladioli]MDN7740397.1 LysR family transcriptional regulator [Burkholderia gladioli]MDN8062305.1 LysR family transcriptional regulator [Burkholderia gladioli]